MKIAPMIILITFLVLFSWLLLKQGITTGKFVVVSFVWIFAWLFFVTENKIEFVKVIFQFFAVLFALGALVISTLTFGLQQTPLLVLSNLSVSEDGQKMYLYFQNKGNIGVYRFNGCFVITSHQEPESGKTSDEKVLAFGTLNIIDEAFYPDTSNFDIVSVRLSMKEPIAGQKGFVYFSIAINYPRLQIWKFEVPPRKGYEGVFMFDKATSKWAKHSKTHLPEYFQKIFSALKNNIQPDFHLT